MVSTETDDGTFCDRRRGRRPKESGAPVHRRPTEQISYREASTFVEALHFARLIGQEPNRHVTIQWRHAPSRHPIPERLRRVLNNTGTLIKRRTGKAAVWAYCREVGRLKGEHLHMVLYVPDRVWPEYRRMLRHWLEIETDEPVMESAVCFQTIKPGTLQTDLKGYFLKEGAENVRFLWVKNRVKHKPTGGRIEGKRLKVSHSIGQSARRANPDAYAPRVRTNINATEENGAPTASPADRTHGPAG